MKEININGMTEDDILLWWSTKRKKGNNSHYRERKYTDIELRIVYRYIHELMKRGYTKRELVNYLSDKTGIRLSNAYIWVDKAYAELIADMDESIEQTRQVARERLEEMYKNALENNQMNIALKAHDQLNKINGLYEHLQEIKVENDTTIKFEFGE